MWLLAELFHFFGLPRPPLVLHKFFGFHSSRFHEWTESVEQLVPVIEEGLEVGHRLQVVHVMFWGPAHHPERLPVVDTERELVAYVRLNADHNTQQHVAPGGQWMALEEPRVGGGQETDGDQLPGVEILGHPHKRAVVPVVDGMDMLVQKAHLVVRPMPDIVLEVEDHQTGYLVRYEFQQGGG